MKSVITNKLFLKFLSVSLIRLSFIAAMILGVFHVSMHINEQSVAHEGKPSKTIKIAAHQISEQNVSLKKTGKNIKPDCNKKVECALHPIILKAAAHHRVDPALVKAIIMAESGYNIRAISKRGAKGLMQLMPSTAEALGVVDAFNPRENISGGVRYFKQLVNQFNGDIKLALAAYNAGSKNVRDYNGVPPYKATQYYIKKVFKYYDLYKNQMTRDLGKA